MIEQHPNIETPSDDTLIWRYLDIERFIALIESNKIFLSRLDKMKDTWESTWPQKLLENIATHWPKDEYKWFFSDKLKYINFVSCWHESKSESAALWDLYSGKSGIAIQSTVGSLKRSICEEKSLFLGRVNYIDFEHEDLPELNMLIPPFLKRKSFEHEKEIRLLLWDPVNSNTPNEFHELNIDISILIENLYISPFCPDWFVSALAGMCKKYNITAPVIKSSLYDARVY